MTFGTTATPQQLEEMERVVAAYCKHVGVKPGTSEEENVASVIWALHEVGIRGENELLQALIVPTGRLPSRAA